MVWVPDLALRSDFLGLGPGFRAPSPPTRSWRCSTSWSRACCCRSWCWLAGWCSPASAMPVWSARRLRAQARGGQLAVWNPFVVERLVIGHWPVLLGYAVLPWLVLAGASATVSSGSRLVWFLLPLGSLSASAGLVSALVVLVTALGRPDRGRRRPGGGLLCAVNAPWVVAGTAPCRGRAIDTAGCRRLRAARRGLLPAPLSALGLGGIWNGEVVPASRDGCPGWRRHCSCWWRWRALGAGAGGRRRRRRPASSRCWAVGCARLAWSAGWPRTRSAWVAGMCRAAGCSVTAPGCSPCACRCWRPGGRGRRSRHAASLPPAASRGAALARCCCAPADRADARRRLGRRGRLAPSDYPASLPAARDARSAPDGRRRCSCRSRSYRSPAWNDGRKVLDPLGRYLEPDYVASDD